ncbi:MULTISPECIES: hypothetical protein [unclassified Mycobacterium]|uniref:hypothetical protein n=1 Tax=unclassified Mycobacterium TaxID=2642494 RepID=UPI0029C94091|nr:MULTISPECIES: hypothetical protein [unclassified Mycobacterium]
MPVSAVDEQQAIRLRCTNYERYVTQQAHTEIGVKAHNDYFHELMAHGSWDNSPTWVFANVSALVQAVRAVVE